jgi:lysophospholipase L1-like esterase
MASFGQASVIRALDPISVKREPETPYFKGWVALGDSYSAAPGAGGFHSDGPTPNRCLRYKEAYPLQMALSISGNDGGRECPVEGIQPLFLSCTGATVEQRAGTPNLNEQIKYIHDLPGSNGQQFDFATLSIGGNDLGFSTIVQKCLFPLTFEKDTWKTACDNAISNAEKLLDMGGDGTNSEIRKRLNGAYTNVLDEMYFPARDPNGGVNIPHRATDKFHLFITGYTNFFNDTDTSCNDFSFESPAFGAPGGGTKLAPEFRTRLNKLVERLNDRSRQAIDDINTKGNADYNGKVSFVEGPQDDWTNHRFCDNNTPQNKDKLFYFQPSLLPFGGDNLNTAPELPLNKAEVIAAVDAFTNSPGFAQKTFDAIKAAEPNAEDDTIWKRLFVGIIRGFHPTKSGYLQMRNRVCDFICYQYRDSHPSCPSRR